MKHRYEIKRRNLYLVGALSVTAAVSPSLHADVDFADTPLFVGSTVDPNLMFIIDDSGSMLWSHIPDEIETSCGSGSSVTGRALGRSYDYNKLYFNPDKPGGYLPPVDLINGSGPNDRLPNADFNDAWVDGYFAATSGTVNLETSFRATWRWPWVGSGNNRAFCGSAGAADYYRFEPGTCASGSIDDTACYTRYTIDPTDDAMKQSFANWYSYYRSRILASRGGIGEAFSKVPQNFRLGWGRLNKGSTTIDDASSVRAVQSGVRPLTDDRRKEFYEWLYAAPANGSTPLRRALEGAGEYYRKSDRAWTDNPAEDYDVDLNDMRACRQAFTILMTDGYYNGGSPGSKHLGADDTIGATHTNDQGASYQYLATEPFNDGVNGNSSGLSGASLAEVATYYWKNDLKPGLDNLVPVLEKDLSNPAHDERVANPAFWQHMVTFGVGLGVSGSVDPDDAFTAIDTGDVIDWWGGSTANDRAERKIDDLLHAAVNSRGGFFSAGDPDTFGTELAGVINDIAGRTGSASSIDFETTRAQVGSLVFSAQFDTNNWSGDIKAAELIQEDPPIVPDFTSNFQQVIDNDEGWSAAQLLDNRNLSSSPRTIFTYNEDTTIGAEFKLQGGEFKWDELSLAQQADLQSGGADVDLAKLRGEYIIGHRDMVTDPATEDEFHKRDYRLGSIIHSSPRFVARPSSRWPNLAHIGDGLYSEFVQNYADRTPTVYAGSNGGKLHAFRATGPTEDGGEELFAYVPGFLASTDSDRGLHYLTRPGTSHRYYVDLEVHVQDVFSAGRNTVGGISGEDWRTVLIGGGRTGAKGLFALDVTDPDQVSPQQSVMWEFTEDDDARLGYITAPPVIAQAYWAGENRWTVFVPNGYNSATESTGFFMLDVEGGLDGEWNESDDDYVYIEFEGAGDNPSGLSPLIELDMTGDLIVNRVYAGDLKGNIWVADGSSGNWSAAYTDPLFTADRPIVAMPNVVANYAVEPTVANSPNLMVYFGTGRYFDLADIDNTDEQYIFGVWDRGQAELDSDDLVERTFTQSTETDKNGNLRPVRHADGDDIDYSTDYGWKIPLPDTGERVITSSVTRFVDEDDSKAILYMSSMIPDVEACLGGGSGWTLALGLDGSTPEEVPFLDFEDPNAGFKNESMQTTDPRFWGEWMMITTVDGSITATPTPPEVTAGAGRRGWQEVMQ